MCGEEFQVAWKTNQFHRSNGIFKCCPFFFLALLFSEPLLAGVLLRPGYMLPSKVQKHNIAHITGSKSSEAKDTSELLIFCFNLHI